MVIWLGFWAFAIEFVRCLSLDIQYDDIGGQIGIFGSFDGLTYYNDKNDYNLAVPPQGANSYTLNGTFDFVNQTLAPVSQAFHIGTNTLLTIQDGFPSLYDVVTGGSISLQGWRTRVTGDVKAVYQNSSLLFLGGNLTVDGRTHGVAVYDLSQRQIVDAPFDGFNENATVNAIVELEDGLIFGGNFYALKNYTHDSITTKNITVVNPEQQVSLKHASISGNGDGSMICPGSTWKLPEGNVGEWNAELPVSVNPSKMRIFNGDNDGVRLFRVLTYPSESIMNLTYIEPGSNQVRFCDAWCPLLSNISSYDPYSTNYTNEETTPLGYSSNYQEFAFHNRLSVSRITLQVLSFYGSRAELSGFQLFQNEIVAYANDTLNDPSCSDTDAYSFSSYLDQSSWKSADEGYIYSSVNITDSVPTDLGVSFHPNISYSGNYTLNLYTPGCLNDDTCSERGIVNVTVFDGYNDIKSTRLIYQTNEYEKYDTIFSGHLDVNDEEESGPYVEMSLFSAVSYSSDQLIVVADRVTAQIDGIDDSYFQNQTKSDEISLNGLFEYLPHDTSYSVGNSSINVLGNHTLPQNATVNGLAVIDGELLIGGDFNASQNVISASRFFPLNESIVVVDDDQIKLFNGSWFELDDAVDNDFSPKTMASFTVEGQNYLVFNGMDPSVRVWQWEDDVTFGSWSNMTSLNVSAAIDGSVFGSVKVVDLLSNNSAIAKSHLETAPQVSGTVQASLYVNSSLQVIGGNEVTFINGNKSHTVEIDGEATALLSYENKLFVGTKQGRGLLIYDMASSDFETSPSVLYPEGSMVSTLSFNDNQQILAVGGNFASAGSLSCAGLCLYSLESQRWISPSQTISGEIHYAKFFSNSELLISGNFTVDGSPTYFAVYNFDSKKITLQESLNTNAPGAVKKFILVDDTVNGRILAIGDTFVSFYSGSSWFSIDQGLDLDDSELCDMALVPVSSSLKNQTVVDSHDGLLVSGSINLRDNGTVGAALYNGETWFPYLIASDNGTINSLMIYKSAQSLGDITTAPSYMGRGGVVFASMAVALGTSLLLGGLLVALRKASDKRNGYNRPLQSRVEESEMMKTVPPDQLISGMDYAKYAQ